MTRPAGAGARIGAYLVDLAAVGAVAAAAGLPTRSWLVAAVVAVEGGVVLSIARAATGRTPGALATRTVAHQAGSDLAPGLRAQSVRSLVLGLLHLTGIGPLLTAATSREGRDWVDRLSGTAVADARPTPEPMAVPTSPYARTTGPGTASIADGPAVNEVAATATPRRAMSGPATEAVLRPVPASTWPPHAAATPAPAVPEEPVQAWAVFDSGLRFPVVSVTVIGREPVPSGDQTEHLVTVPDATRSLSRTHLRAGVDGSGVWIEDAFSANGTSCRTPDGRLVELTRGHRLHVPLGTVVLLGDRSFTLSGA
nr:FHA domain-containing protein [Propionicimonas sp.]